jgi:hydrogenase assembly chaperone HypC/HupF
VGKEISLALVDDVAVGDYVIVHVGYALTRLDPEEAEKTLALFAELGEAALQEVTATVAWGEGPNGRLKWRRSSELGRGVANEVVARVRSALQSERRQMRFIDEFRDGELARGLAAAIRQARAARIATITSWSSAAGTRTPSRATGSRICCRVRCA